MWEIAHTIASCLPAGEGRYLLSTFNHTPHIGESSMSRLLKRCFFLWARHTWPSAAVSADGLKFALGSSIEQYLISSCALSGTQNSLFFNTTCVCRRQPSSEIVWKCITLVVWPHAPSFPQPPRPSAPPSTTTAIHGMSTPPPPPPSASQPESNAALSLIITVSAAGSFWRS